MSLRRQDPKVARTLPPHFATKDQRADTAGTPWHVRDLTPSHFPGDVGERNEAVAKALDACDAGQDPTREKLVEALAGTRVLIPIQAIATETATTASGLHADNASDMAMLKLQLRDGQMALPVFTSAAALSAWSPEARPVPMVLEQAAQSAVAEGCTCLALDLGRDGAPLVLRRSALWAIAQGRRWCAPYKDSTVLDEVEALVAAIDGVDGAEVLAGQEREVELKLGLTPGLEQAELDALMTRVHTYLAHSQVIAERVSSLKITVVPARR
ncbi:SseB family protein [Dermabacter hominis]|uniref:SseB family protein n=1 Tax=Dermabacter hominis TaxID=36740 RepID=UPI000C7948F8|nr:SseB family protein [Dermabacter hominis]